MLNPIISARSAALDLLRFFAVFIVFFAHYTDTFNYVYKIVPANLKWLNISCYGAMALLLFFIVSGYVVTMTSIKRNLSEFVIARLSRIYPLFWVSCLSAFILTRLIDHTFLPFVSIKTLLINLTMFPGLFGKEMINPVFHTLLLEMVFYVFIGIVIGFRLWKYILTIISLLLFYCIYEAFKQTVSIGFIILPFTAGMLFYFINKNYTSKWKLYSLLVINFACQLAMSNPLKIQFSKFYKEYNVVSLWAIFGIICFIYFLFLLIATEKLKIQGRKIYQVLGEITYPFYLFHIYFLCFYWYFRDKIQADLLLFLIFIVIIFTSFIINILIEKPFTLILQSILKKFLKKILKNIFFQKGSF